MRMHFVVPFITLLSLVSVNADHPNHLGRRPAKQPCKCGPKFHSIVAFMDPTFNRTFCGGTIINNRQVLTLAQCVTSINRQDFKVMVKAYNDDAETAYDVKSIVFHTEGTMPGRDIALVKIVGTFSDAHLESTVCLPFNWPEDIFVGANYTTMGWYRRTDDIKSLSTNTQVKLNGNSHCVEDDDYLKKKCLCTDWFDEDYTEYHGGEPVFWEIEDNLQVQIGIVLPRITSKGVPVTAYLRIGSFVDWIESRAPRGFSYCKIR